MQNYYLNKILSKEGKIHLLNNKTKKLKNIDNEYIINLNKYLFYSKIIKKYSFQNLYYVISSLFIGFFLFIYLISLVMIDFSQTLKINYIDYLNLSFIFNFLILFFFFAFYLRDKMKINKIRINEFEESFKDKIDFFDKNINDIKITKDIMTYDLYKKENKVKEDFSFLNIYKNEKFNIIYTNIDYIYKKYQDFLNMKEKMKMNFLKIVLFLYVISLIFFYIDYTYNFYESLGLFFYIPLSILFSFFLFLFVLKKKTLIIKNTIDEDLSFYDLSIDEVKASYKDIKYIHYLKMTKE